MPKKANNSGSTAKRFFLGITLGVLLMVGVGVFVFPVRTAQAFPGEAMAAAIWKFASEVARDSWKIAKDAAEEAYKITKDVAFKNALRIYLTKIAEDTATYIATGDSGQKPLFLTQPGKYFLDVGDAALGDYLDTISSGALGASICDIGPVKVKINLALRAEINPNFCVDGCQKSYEESINSHGDMEIVQEVLQAHLDTYVKESFGSYQQTCSALTTEAQCVAAIECSYDTTNSTCNADATKITRALTDDELSPLWEKVDIIETQRPASVCLHHEDDLRECIGDYKSYLDTQRQKHEYDRQRCVRLCTGAKRTAKCTFTQIKERSVAAFTASEFRATYTTIFQPEQNEVGQYLSAYQTARESADQEREIAKEDLTYGEIGSLTSIITGSIITPSTLTKKAAEKPIEESGEDVTTYTGSPVADAIGVFTDTLTKKLIERIFNPQKGYANPQGQGSSLISGGYNSGGISAAKALFAKEFTPNILRASKVNVDTISGLIEDGVIDQDFGEAIRQELTVEQAVAKNLLHPDWWFGYNQNRELPDVGNAGYPATSFPILRSNRIVPVGWEIATTYVLDYTQQQYTLQQMIDEFDNQDSPFYGLVDPKWVLKAPLTLCAAEGYSGELAEGSCIASSPVSSYLDSNNDDPDCLDGEHDTNNDGACDENDPPIYENTCQREQTCVDTQTCIKETSDGQGCEEYGYCTKEKPIWRFQGETCDEQYASCQAYTSSDGEVVSYLTSTLDDSACSADNVGCQRYCYRDTATGEYNCTYDQSNDVYTGDRIHFDQSVEECAASDNGCTELLRTTDGANILPNPSFEYYATPYPTTDQAEFAGWEVGGNDQSCGAQSFADQASQHGAVAMRLQYLSACGGGSGARQFGQSTIDTGRSINDRTFAISLSARALNAPCSGDIVIEAPGYSASFTPTYQSQFNSYNTVVTFTGVVSNTFTVRVNAVQNCPIVVDSVKVEEGGAATAFSDYGDDALYLKVPPANLTCTGNQATDDPECAQYAAVCQEQEVGCMSYTPNRGGMSLPAKVTDPSLCDFANNPGACDQCPAAFLGCTALRELDLTSKVPDATDVNRASIGLASLVPESGNICSAQYVGCEEYTNLDEVARGGEGREYFTTVRQCVNPDDPQKAYYYSWQGSASTGYELVRYELKQSNFDDGPCTNLLVSDTPNAACEDNNSGGAADNVNQCDSVWGRDPNCYEFFDEGGDVFYRYVDEVIFVTDQCQPHRNTLDGNTYYFDSTKSTSCPAEFAGCREYHGAAANNTRNVFTDDFESVSNPLSGWDNAGGATAVTTESLTFGGHSITVGVAQTNKDVTVTGGKSYIVSFWAKAIPSSNVPLNVWLENAPADHYFTWNGATTDLTVGPEWNYYRLGPIEADWSPLPTSILMRSAVGVYIDNIQLTETTQNIFLVRNSASSCNGFEGCSAYTDQLGENHYLKGFSQLCNSSAVGCEALIHTQNSTYPFMLTLDADQSYPQGNGSFDAQVPPDTTKFFVNDSAKYCSESVKGCTELGAMTIDQSLEVTSITSVYLKNNPDQFDTILCQEEAVGCEQYTELENQSSLAFFKDPDVRTCEYRTNDDVTGLTGWFKQGTSQPCNVPWTRECPVEQSTCREYFAPRIYANPATPGEQSYYYKDSSLSKNQCTSGIDPQNSCLGFQDVKAGNNTVRPRFSDTDENTVISQSCTTCSPDSETCGRNGNSPCCTWSSSACSADRTTGSDNTAPYYCVQGATEDLFQSCPVGFSGSYAVPNHSDPTQATNCGQTGQPGCFDMDGTHTATTDDDWNAANEALRNCSDYACTANVIIPVTPDRTCEEWLQCTNEITTTRNGKETTLCLERKLANTDGFIDEGIGDNVQENLVKSTPSEVRDLANYSGLVSAGILETGIGNLVNGLYPYSQFEEDGEYGAEVDVPNGDFEGYKIAVAESPMPIRETTGAGGAWINESEFDWKSTRDAGGLATSLLQIEKTDEANQFSNQYLSVVSRSTGENGARVILGSIDEINEEADYYMLSFDARRSGTLSKGMRFSVYQPGVGDLFLDLTDDGYSFSDQWQKYIVKLYNNPGANLDSSGDNIEIRVLHRAGNVPSESLDIDNVSLKPVLHIQDAKSLVPQQGLYGTYFQAKLVPAVGSQQGLTGEYWDGTDDGDGDDVPDNPLPATGTGDVQWVAQEVNYKHPNTTSNPVTESLSSGTCAGGARSGAICFNGTSCPTSIVGGDYVGPFFACNGMSQHGDGYRVRFTGGILIENEDENRFYFNHDDGARFYVEDLNTDLLSSTWLASACVGSSVVLNDMPAGWHPVKIEWYNKEGSTGYGALQFGWHPGTGGLPYLDKNQSPDLTEFDGLSCGIACHPTLGSFSMICDNSEGGDIVSSDRLITELTIDTNAVFTDGFLISSGMDSTIDFPDFNARLQEKANRGDAVGVRWVGEIYADATGIFNFAIRHKDGFRLYIDDLETPLGEDWTEAVVQTDTVGPYTMSAGWHQIKIEFFKGLDQGADAAVMQFGWDRPGSTSMGGGFNVVPEDHLRAFPEAPTGFVARECRSYPQSDALVCDYQDPQSGVVYRGWKGYCVERDPRDEKVCLNWWPIDVLSGDTNVFEDQTESLTRAPLYMCAETEVKDPPMSMPRYICLSNYKSDDEHGMSHDRCATVAIVDSLLPAGYELTSADGWIYGSGSVSQGDGRYDCRLNPGQYTGVCCELNQFGGSACTSSFLARAHDDDGDASIENQAEWDRCVGELEKYYTGIHILNFTDDGDRYSEGCSGDDWGDDNDHCIPGGDNCYYRSLQLTAPFLCGFSLCNLDGQASFGSGYFSNIPNYRDLFSFPMQCTTLVQVTEADGDSTPWTSKVQSGNYEDPPTLFTQGTACSPWGATPVISRPSDIYNCIPDPNNAPANGCSTVTGSCEKLVSTDSGECILGPLELYHPNNPDNNTVSSICSETRLGGGFYSCGTLGICKTCVGGDRNGLSCQCDSTSPISAACPDNDGDGVVDVNDCPGEGNPLSSIDPTKTAPTCEQTFGRDESLGDADDTFLYQPLTTQAPYSSDPRSGISRIKQLFAKSYGFWTWDDTAERYVRREDLKDWAPPVDDGRVGDGYRCPDATTHVTDSNVYCGIRPTVSDVNVVGGIAVGSDIILSGANHQIDLTFNYSIDPEQTPLKGIAIHWGDSDPKSLYKSGSASKVYRCNSIDGINCEPVSATEDCPGAGVLQPFTDPTDIDPETGVARVKNACIYDNYPKIQVEDNWGWCNNQGCGEDAGTWDFYNGRIIVLP